MSAFRKGHRPASDLFDEMVIDCFAGGGGASTGIEAGIGRACDIAINHDAEAVALHSINHPNTRHYCEDVFQVDPLEATGGRAVGLAWFSPDCKHFSKAKGGKPVSKRVRGLAWVVVKWARAVKPRVIMLENVEEFTTWGPLGADNRPCPEHKGRTFRRWKRSLEQLGYVVEHRELRACDYGAPTIRKRLFVIARCDGQPITWPEPTHAKAPAKGLRPWRTAAECIDWSIPCPSIFDRMRPLKPATLARIARGIFRFVINDPKPFIVPVTHSKSGPLGASIDDPLRTVTTAKGGEFALVAPTLIQQGYGEAPGQAPRCLDIGAPLGTVVASAGKHALVAAFMAQHNGGATGHRADSPVSTLCSRATQQQVVTAFLASSSGPEYSGKPRPVDAPLNTMTTDPRNGLVAASLVKLRGTCKDGQRVAEPMPTLTAGGNHVGLVAAFLTAYYGNEQEGQSVSDPLRTATTKERFALVSVPLGGTDWIIADIGMRMLVPRELFRAQGFPAAYVIDRVASGPLTKTAQVRMCGNSVCPPVAEAIVRANFGTAKKAKVAA